MQPKLRHTYLCMQSSQESIKLDLQSTAAYAHSRLQDLAQALLRQRTTISVRN